MKEEDKVVLELMGKKIHRLRTKKRLTQEDLAIAIQVDRVTIAGLEAGKHNVRPSILLKMCDYFKINASSTYPTPLEYVRGKDGFQESISKIKIDRLARAQRILTKLKSEINQ